MLVFDPRHYGANPNDNVDDTYAIQAALDAARDAGGGHVLLSSGTYILTGSGKASDGALRIYDNTEISGAGIGQTILKIADGWDSKITGIIRTPVNEATENVIIRDITLDGNRENVNADIDGIMTGVLPGKDEHDNNILIERVEIHDVSRIAFNPHEQTHNLTIRDSIAHHNSWDGFVADYVVNGVYENNIAFSNDRHGFNVVTHSNNMVLKDNVSYDNAEQGIVLQRGSGSTSIDGWETLLNHDILVINNEVYNNGKNGILLKQVQDNQVIGNTIYNNGDDGIQIEGSFGNIIDDNTINANINGIEVRAYNGSIAGPDTSHDNIIMNNYIIAKNHALAENHGSTVNNIYAENNINELSLDLGIDATVLSQSDDLIYTLLQIDLQIIDNSSNDLVDIIAPAEGMFISGDSTSQTLRGDSGSDTLKGRDGNDILYGALGDDYLEGNDGDDILYGGGGFDTLKGSSGIDTFAFENIGDAGDIIIDFKYNEKLDLSEIVNKFDNFYPDGAFKDGFLRLEQDASNTNLYINTDGAYGTSEDILFLTMNNVDAKSIDIGNFILETDSNPIIDEPAVFEPRIVDIIIKEVDPVITDIFLEEMSLSGSSSNDILTGNALNDKLVGRDGDDILVGNGGDDSIWGNNGDDILYGGSGSDTLKGGEGNDIFVFDAMSLGFDKVADFRSGDILAINDILEFDPFYDSILNFIEISDDGNNTTVSVDIDGLENGENFVGLVQLSGITNLGDAQSLYDSDVLLINKVDFV